MKTEELFIKPEEAQALIDGLGKNKPKPKLPDRPFRRLNLDLNVDSNYESNKGVPPEETHFAKVMKTRSGNK